MKKAIVSVINDLATDQRVNRSCLTLIESGYEVLLVGRELKNSLPLSPRPYSMHRMKLLFTTGVPFYVEFQIRLFFLLLFKKTNLYFSNDLDTLLPNYILSKLKGIPLIYDSHEYFTGVPELMEHPFKRSVWKRVEKMIIPKLKYMFTVNDSIANLYLAEFGIPVRVIRNLPIRKELPIKATRESLNLPTDKSIILLQGAGININRGAEEALESMKLLEDCLLLIIGSGDALESLKQLTQKLNLTDRVKFIPKLPFDELMQYTMQADIGLSIDKDTNINYRYSLPNKLFDYIQAEVPVLASNLVEVQKIVQQYNVGVCIESHIPEEIAGKIKFMLADKERLRIWKANAAKAKETLCWQNEKTNLSTVLLTIK